MASLADAPRSSSSSSSSYRDRTSEFRFLSENLKRIQGIPHANRNQQQQEAAITTAGEDRNGGDGNANPSSSSSSEFNKRASRIGLGIHETAQKIARLSVLAKRSTIFDDPILEIQEMTALIKNDISALNAALSELQFLQSYEVSNGIQSEDVVVHATTICDDLKSRLMGTTEQFKDVLTSRTQSLKAHEKRKQIFSTNAAREDLFSHRQKKASEPPPWASYVKGVYCLVVVHAFRRPGLYQTANNLLISSRSCFQETSLSSDGVQIANQLRRRPAAESALAEQMEVSMLQQLAPREEAYMQSRATALQSVESTISELGGIFTQLATMVSQQGELAIRKGVYCSVAIQVPEDKVYTRRKGVYCSVAIQVPEDKVYTRRIDDNMDESLANVENARGALVKHLSRISSNRWLLIKIFAVLVVFLLVFVFFVA